MVGFGEPGDPLGNGGEGHFVTRRPPATWSGSAIRSADAQPSDRNGLVVTTASHSASWMLNSAGEANYGWAKTSVPGNRVPSR